MGDRNKRKILTEKLKQMKANYKNKLFYIVFTLLIFTSCQKSFLDRAPENQVSDATFWKTDNDLYLALDAVYPVLDNEITIYRDGASDNAYAQYPWESSATLASSGDITAATDAGWSYTYIRRANNLLEHADQVSMDQTLKERYKAEARFLRAYNYYKLVKLFGDVPLITKTLQSNETDVVR